MASEINALLNTFGPNNSGSLINNNRSPPWAKILEIDENGINNLVKQKLPNINEK